MPDRWESKKIVCKGGLNLEQDVLTQGELNLGSANILINYEPSLEGGYGRILGYSKWDNNTVTGTGPILGVKVALNSVLAARKNVGGTGVDIYKSGGSGWTKINSSLLDVDITKVRFKRYFTSSEYVCITTGHDLASRYDGTTFTTISGTGAPATPKYAEFWNGRLVLAPASNSYTIAISSAVSDTDFDPTNGAAEVNVGQRVIGIRKFRDTLYIFCENSIKKMVGYDASTFQVVSVTESIGCIADDSIQEVAGDLLYLAPDGIRTVAGTEKIGDVELGVLSQKIQPYIRGKIPNITNENWNSVVIRKKSQYRLFTYKSGVPDSSADGLIGKLDVESGQWEWSNTLGINAYCTDSEYITAQTDEVVVFGHPSNGYVYRMERGNSFDGTAVTSTYRTPDFTLDDATIRKVLQKIQINTELEGDLDIDLSAKFDFEEEGILQPKSINITKETLVSYYGESLYGTGIYSSVVFPVIKKNLIGSGFTVAFVFQCTNIQAPHRIDSYQIQYAVKGKR